jgi:heat shock protein HslJ
MQGVNLVIRDRLMRSALAAVLVVSLPAAVAAQDEEPSGPEGIDWTLTSLYDDDSAELVAVPFEVAPTLRLEDGTASGSAGCNTFSGSYQIDGSALRFSDEMSVTLALCEEPAQSIEDAYLAALGEIDGWVIDVGTLELSDDFGDVILTFEVPDIMWTTNQVAALMATLETLQTGMADLQTELDTLRSDTETLNVPRLRERIKTLESENKKYASRLKELESAPAVDPTPKPTTTTAFSSAEKVLLKGIPARVANYCRPLRSALPKATKAAVTCTPNTNIVSSIDYYLMEGDAAASAFGDTMASFNVPETSAEGQTCEDGVKSQRYRIGNGWQAEGCYRTNGRAELRFVDNATNCKKLKVAGKTLPSPAFYIALQGTNNDLGRLYDWATKGLDPESAQLTSITQPIPSKLGTSPSCPT